MFNNDTLISANFSGYETNLQNFNLKPFKEEDVMLQVANLERFKEDRMSDEDFYRGYLYDSPLIEKANREPDTIENMTTQIFLHLHSLADGMNRSDIEAAIIPEEGFIFEKDETYQRSGLHDHERRPFRRETNFYEENHVMKPIRTQKVVRNILSTLGNIFFGCKFLDSTRDSRTAEEVKKDLKHDSLAWRDVLKKHYKVHIQNKMNKAFREAGELLKTRQTDEKVAHFGRLILYSTLLVSVVGKLMQEKVCVVGGLVASSITLIFMIIHYGRSSFKQSQLAAELKSSVEEAEREAAHHRIVQDWDVDSTMDDASKV